MPPWLDTLLVSVLVLGSAGYALRALGPAGVREWMHRRLRPGAPGPLARASGACGGCQGCAVGRIEALPRRGPLRGAPKQPGPGLPG